MEDQSFTLPSKDMQASLRDHRMSDFKVVIHTCRHELFSSIISRYSFITAGFPDDSVSILTLNDIDELRECDGKSINRNGTDYIYNINTSQSHLPIRFCVPEYLDFSYQALVIDPDVFCASTKEEVIKPFENLSKETPIIAREVRGGPFVHGYNSAVMYMDSNELSSWSTGEFINKVFGDKTDLQDYIYLREKSLLEPNQKIRSLEQTYNSYDILNDNTILLHCTCQYTQPWKSGMDLHGKIIDNERVLEHKRYRKHPSTEVETFVINLIRSAYQCGHFDYEFLINEIRLGHISESLIDLIY